MDSLYIGIASRISEMSYARRTKVGAVIVKGDNIISMGWNGRPSGADNNCEIEQSDGSLVTHPAVLHAESNALAKLASTNSGCSSGSTVYVTMSPCFECAKLLIQSKVARVVFRDLYRNANGLDLLKEHGVIVDQTSLGN